MQHATNQQELLLASGRQLELVNEGFLWAPNLTIPDPTIILPVLVGAAFLANIELSAARVSKDLITRGGSKPLPKRYYIFNNLFRTIAVLMVPVSAGVPSSVALYWAVSGYSGLVVNIIMMSPRFRKFVRIPRLKTDPAQPYRTAFKAFRTNWRENFRWFVGVSRKK